MWFSRDESGEKVSEFFPSQAKLAVHMQMNPQTLQRAIRKGKNVFQFLGQEVRVVQEIIPHFAIFDFPPSENPIQTFEWISEVAKWLKVPNQTVYAAVKRGDETKVKNKEGVFWLKKLEVTLSPREVPPVPAPRKNLSREVVPPVPAPRKNLSREVVPVPAWLQNFPQLAQNLPQVLQLLQVLQQGPPLGQGLPLGQNLLLPLLQQQGQGTSPSVLGQKLFMPPLKNEIPVTPPIPWAVAEVLKGGKRHPFTPTKTLNMFTFVSPKTVAQFIRSGLRGNMFAQGPKTKKIILWNEKLIFLPDLIKEILVFYIRSLLFANREATEFLKRKISDYVDKMDYLWFNPKTKLDPRLLGRTNTLDEEFVHNVSKEFMKLIG